MEKLGIEKLKTVIVLLIAFGNKIEDALQDDGKINFFESLQIGIGLAPQVFQAANSAPDIKREILDLSENEKDDLLNYAIDKLDLKNEGVEYALERGLMFLDALNDFIIAIKLAK